MFSFNFDLDCWRINGCFSFLRGVRAIVIVNCLIFCCYEIYRNLLDVST